MKTETVEQLFGRIMEAKKWEKQELAEHIGVHPSTLSQKLGAHWNAHWQVFLKLLPILVELKFLTHDDIYGTSDNVEGSKRPGKLLKSKDDLPENGSKSNDIMLTLAALSVVLH